MENDILEIAAMLAAPMVGTDMDISREPDITAKALRAVSIYKALVTAVAMAHPGIAETVRKTRASQP